MISYQLLCSLRMHRIKTNHYLYNIYIYLRIKTHYLLIISYDLNEA